MLLSIQLDEKTSGAALKQIALSNDGSACVIGGGNDKPYFYLIDLESQEQHKITSVIQEDTYAPCFINGGTELVAFGSRGKFVEVCDVSSKQSVKALDLVQGTSSASTHNILSFASQQGILRLWDIRNWEVVHSSTFDGLKAYSLHLTSDLTYLTIAGNGGDKCVVLQIK